MGVVGADLDVAPNRRRGAVEQARVHIARLLDLREVRPGERLPPATELSLRIGVSRPAVLQALQLLQAEGRLLVRPGRAGTVVVEAEPDNYESRCARLADKQDNVRQMLMLRRIIEPGTARVLAERGLPSNGLDRARALLEDMAREDDRDRYLSLDNEFHRTLGLSLGPVIDALVAVGRVGLAPAFEVLDMPRSTRRRSDREHAKLLEAIAEGDPRKAEQVMARHVRGTEKVIEALLGQLAIGRDPSHHNEEGQ